MRENTSVCLIDTNIFLCLAFEDPGHIHCGQLLDRAFREEYKPLISSIQIAELYTPFLRAGDNQGLDRMREEIGKLELRMRNVDRQIAETAAELHSTIRTPEGRWLALVDSIILATAMTEEAKILYTIDTDFAKVDQMKVEAPGMDLKEWINRYGTEKQREIIRLL